MDISYLKVCIVCYLLDFGMSIRWVSKYTDMLMANPCYEGEAVGLEKRQQVSCFFLKFTNSFVIKKGAVCGKIFLLFLR